MNRLFELRKEKNMSQRDIAKTLNISQGTYNNWENSKTQPSIEQLIQISRFFEVSIDYIVGNAEDDGIIKVNPSISYEQCELLRQFNLLSKTSQQLLLAFLGTLSTSQK